MQKRTFVNGLIAIHDEIAKLKDEQNALVEKLLSDFGVDDLSLEDIETVEGPNASNVAEAIECFVDYGEGDSEMLGSIYDEIKKFSKGSDQR